MLTTGVHNLVRVTKSLYNVCTRETISDLYTLKKSLFGVFVGLLI